MLSKVCSVGYLTTSVDLVCINVASEYLCTLSFCQDYEQYRPSSWLTEVEPKSSPYYPQVGDAVSGVICDESISSLIPEQCSEEVHCAVQY